MQKLQEKQEAFVLNPATGVRSATAPTPCPQLRMVCHREPLILASVTSCLDSWHCVSTEML